MTLKNIVTAKLGIICFVGINNFAHIGGLIGGAMASMAVGVKYKSSKQDKINGTIVLAILLMLLIYKIFM